MGFLIENTVSLLIVNCQVFHLKPLYFMEYFFVGLLYLIDCHQLLHHNIHFQHFILFKVMEQEVKQFILK